jgi:REP element-mobilizing transposase RayT
MSYVYEIGGIEDHVHMLLSLPCTICLAKLVELIKKDSSKWLKTKSPSFQFFAWQNGYGAFSVSASNIEVVRKYILEQEMHHKKTKFQEEFLMFLKKTNISFDEKYLWD